MSVRSWTRWWRAPFWLLALSTGAKSFVDNPIMGSRRLNQRGLHASRVKLAHRLARARRRRLASNVPPEWREQFERHGFVEVRDFLPPEVFARLRSALVDRPHISFEQQQGDTITRRTPIGPVMLRSVPELRDLIAGKKWRALLAYVGSTRSEPLYYLQTILSGHAEGPTDPQLELHADTFHPSLKAWLFLTDVTDGQAPLTYVSGSHRATPERIAWEQARSIAIADHDRLSQRGSLRVGLDELTALGLAQPHAFAVPANTLVAIDTFGFHARGSASQPSVRAEIWAYSRRGPFVPWAGFDLLSLPPIAKRRASWLPHLNDAMDRLGFKKHHWRRVGSKRALEP